MKIKHVILLFSLIGFFKSSYAASDSLYGELDIPNNIYDAFNLIGQGTGVNPPGLRFRNNASGNDWWIWMNENQSGDLFFESETPGSDQTRIVLRRLGYLGVGITVPQDRLHIASPNYNDLFSIERLEGSQANRFELLITSSPSGVQTLNNRSLTLRAAGHAADFSVLTDPTWHYPRFVVKKDGKVGVGTHAPAYELDVDGTARAKEIIVESNWADFVFEEDYELMPLEEVAEHIEREKRLPGVRSAEEIQAEGASVGETQAMLLQKVEELTLHLIEKDRQIQQLEKRLSRLENHDQ